jgi:hypothetical protein
LAPALIKLEIVSQLVDFLKGRRPEDDRSNSFILQLRSQQVNPLTLKIEGLPGSKRSLAPLQKQTSTTLVDGVGWHCNRTLKERAFF